MPKICSGFPNFFTINLSIPASVFCIPIRLQFGRNDCGHRHAGQHPNNDQDKDEEDCFTPSRVNSSAFGEPSLLAKPKPRLNNFKQFDADFSKAMMMKCPVFVEDFIKAIL
ncbi:hypothetical protein niasHT_026754 [Heterodera trifolii]|uniref:Uncharacterized protein n=1 Tax=Heterodera trifolii TaxID=157864 RepID=A0ABD2JP17_9BILA